jgi:hypothetical protein
MKDTGKPSREDDVRMRRVMDRLRLLLGAELSPPEATHRPAGGPPRNAAVSGEIVTP